MRKVGFFGIFFIVLAINSFAQSSQDIFGKNRIQYKALNWKVIETDRFEVFYYGEYGESFDLAQKVATYGESDLDRLASSLSYSPSDKIKIVLYNSVTDQLQSNIGLANDELMVGGQTILVKSKVEVAFRGNQLQLMEDISYGIAAIMIDNMMYGGSIKDVVKNTYLMHLPDWFMQGAPAHLSAGWSQEMDNFVRDLAINKKLHAPGAYSGKEARIIGHSVFNYIEREYSLNDLSVVIGYTKIFRDIEESVEAALGVSYGQFIQNWKTYYRTQGLELSDSYNAPGDSVRVRRVRKNVEYTHLAISPGGKYIAWTSHKRGRYTTKILDTEKKKTKTIQRGGYRRLDQPIDVNTPVVGWQSEKNLAVAYRKKLKLYFKTIDLEKGKSTVTELKGFRQVFSFSYSQNGSAVVFSADKMGQSDLFVLSGGDIRQLTNDAFDDQNPVYVGADIIFSSNRFSDTLNAYPKALPDYAEAFHLYKLKPGAKSAERLPLLNNNQFLAGSSKQNYLLNDETGIWQLYSYSGGEPDLISDNITDYKFAAIDPASSKFAYVTRLKGKEGIYLTTIPVTKIKKQNTERRNYVKGALSGDNDSQNSSQTDFSSRDEINLDDVIFEGDVAQDSSILDTFNKPVLPSLFLPVSTSTGAPYANPFSGDKINATLMADPIRSWGMLLEAGTSDLIGNHRINGGAFLSFDFRSNRFFGEYDYLKRRVDIKLRFDREAIFATNEFLVVQHYILNKFNSTFSYPFSPYHRVSVSPGLAHTRFGELTDQSSILAQDKRALYQNVKFEYVYDNSLVTGINMLRGTKAKFSFDVYNNSGSPEKSFSNYNIDIRKYIPIHKELTLALRAAHGGFLGKAPKNYLLGGMDNWLNNNREFYSTINNGPSNPLVIDQNEDNSDLLFVKYVTNVRGFKYQSQFGTKYVLFNAEFRIPIVQYLTNRTIGSAFVRNFQVVTFADAGSAYVGNNPFSTDNSQNTQDITGYPFKATVRNYRSPFLYGYGMGVRTLFLGYYVKFDLGFGVKEGIKQKPQGYITFGYDF